MKTIITKEFNDVDDQDMARVFMQAPDMYFALGDIAQEFRTTLKHNVRYDEKQMEAIEEMSEKFYMILGEWNINLNVLC